MKISGAQLLQRGIIRKKVRLWCALCQWLAEPELGADGFYCHGCGNWLQPARADDLIEETVCMIPPNPNDKGGAKGFGRSEARQELRREFRVRMQGHASRNRKRHDVE